MGKGRNPFAGKRVPTSNTKATQIPSTGKKKKGQAGGDNAAAAKNGGGGGGKKGKRAGRSFLGLVAAGAGFAGDCPCIESLVIQRARAAIHLNCHRHDAPLPSTACCRSSPSPPLPPAGHACSPVGLECVEPHAAEQ
jgi:hypothetical protein